MYTYVKYAGRQHTRLIQLARQTGWMVVTDSGPVQLPTPQCLLIYFCTHKQLATIVPTDRYLLIQDLRGRKECQHNKRQ